MWKPWVQDIIKHEKTMKRKWGVCSYYMRRWLRLTVVQLFMSSYPQPISSWYPEGINCNTGGVLSMKCEDEQWRLIVYLSKYLNKIEKSYEIHNKEMLVVIRGLENWQHLLKSTKFKFEVWTDHKNLEYFIKA